MRAPGLLLAVALSTTGACARQPETPKPAAAPTAAQASSPVVEGRRLLEQGQLDQALARLQAAADDPEGLYLQGLVWAKKAETAPLPTPPPAPSPLPRGAPPPAAPELKLEEVTAVDLLEKAVAAKPDLAGAHLALAELLAPHAIRRNDAEMAAKKQPRGKSTALRPPDPGPDYGVERVVQALRSARRADPKSREAVEAQIRFAARIGRLDEAEAGLQELTTRDPEKPEPFIRYGDFLANDKKDPMAAVDQYKQALVWRADDDVTRGKIAETYLAQGLEHWKAGQFGVAESRLKEAQKFVTDRNSPQGVKVQEYLGKLRALRQR
jgi:tetratricopeptide (TPR) repeat protein